MRIAIAVLTVFSGILGLGQAGAEPAKLIFSAKPAPLTGPAEIHGSYSKGCLAGAVELAETGAGWQAMRLSRNRNWAHPAMIAFLERLSRAAARDGWPRLYVGDISQPRGGPMMGGHRSHQVGLDADIWLRIPDTNPLNRAD
nr:penicillin-insensitive murein endopeptidase [Xanthomonadales bacterium]